jgi:hypothetical protein
MSSESFSQNPIPDNLESTQEKIDQKIEVHEVTREEIVGSFKKTRQELAEDFKLHASEITSENKIPESTRKLYDELIDTKELIDTWNIDDLRYRILLQVTMAYIDAGLRDENDLGDALTELNQDERDAPTEKGNLVREKTRTQYKLAIKKVQALLRNKTYTETDYDLSDINLNPEKVIENLRHFDVMQALMDANTQAAQENPDYKKNRNEGIMLVWKYLPDEIKMLWNNRTWNPDFIIHPDWLEANIKVRNLDIDTHNMPEPKKKVSIKKPGGFR